LKPYDVTRVEVAWYNVFGKMFD